MQRKRLRCIAFSTILALSLASVIARAERALSWGLSDLDPTSPSSGVRRGLRQLDPTDPNSDMGKDLHAKIKLCNNTGTTISYTMDDNLRNIVSGSCTTWTVTGKGWLRFDREFRSGYQGKTYRLNDGTYDFVSVTWPGPYGDSLSDTHRL